MPRMNASDFISRAELLKGGSVVEQGSLIAMLMKMDRLAAHDREAATVNSEKIGLVSAQHAANLLSTYRGMLHSD